MTSPLLTPELAGQLGRIDLVARLAVEGFLLGLHKSPYHGFSAEFAEYLQLATVESPAIGGAFVAFRGSLVTGANGVTAANKSGLWRADAAGVRAIAERRSRREGGGAVLRASEVIRTDVSRQREIGRAIDRRVHEGRGAACAPVFDR